MGSRAFLEVEGFVVVGGGGGGEGTPSREGRLAEAEVSIAVEGADATPSNCAVAAAARTIHVHRASAKRPPVIAWDAVCFARRALRARARVFWKER